MKVLQFEDSTQSVQTCFIRVGSHSSPRSIAELEGVQKDLGSSGL